MTDPHITKTCSKCSTPKPTSEFSKHGSTRDKKNPWCKPCVKEYEKTWKAKNYGKVSEGINAHVKSYKSRKAELKPEKTETSGLYYPPPFYRFSYELQKFIRVVPAPRKLIDDCSKKMRAITQRYDVNPYLLSI